jgi:tight adherence protein C
MIAAASISFFLLMISIVAAIAYFVAARTPATATLGPSSAASPADAAEESLPSDLPRLIELLHRVGSLLRPSGFSYREARSNLMAAGFRDDWTITAFQGARLIASVALPILCGLFFYTMNPDFWSVAPAVIFSGYIGFRAPDFLLNRRIRERRQKLKRGLPDLLDLLVISIESGLSLDSAISSTIDDLSYVHPVISDELSVLQYEVQAGKSRAEALRNLGQRTGEPELRKLSSLLIQADRFGTSVAKVLRSQARYLRVRRRLGAEEMAHKVGVKLIFPIFLLIMPSMFLVTVGPAVIQLLQNLDKFTKGL